MAKFSNSLKIKINMLIPEVSILGTCSLIKRRGLMMKNLGCTNDKTNHQLTFGKASPISLIILNLCFQIIYMINLKLDLYRMCYVLQFYKLLVIVNPVKHMPCLKYYHPEYISPQVYLSLSILMSDDAMIFSMLRIEYVSSETLLLKHLSSEIIYCYQ